MKSKQLKSVAGLVLLATGGWILVRELASYVQGVFNNYIFIAGLLMVLGGVMLSKQLPYGGGRIKL